MLVRPGTSPFEAFNHPHGVAAFYAEEQEAIAAMPEVTVTPVKPLTWVEAELAELGFSTIPGEGRAHYESEQLGLATAERVAAEARVYYGREGEFATDDIPESKLAVDGTRKVGILQVVVWLNRPPLPTVSRLVK